MITPFSSSTTPFATASERMLAVQTPIIPIVAELIRANPGTLSLGQGVVHYPPPPEAFERLRSALTDPILNPYGAVGGIPPLVEQLKGKLAAENGIVIDRHRHVLVTAGGNMAFMNAVLAITDPGDEIIVQTPYYFNHEMAITIAGCTPMRVPMDAAYQLQPDAVRAALTDRTRAVVTISPNNPTGTVYHEEHLRAVNALCKAHGLYHIHDEAYEYFTYGDTRPFSPGGLDGSAAHTISLYSFSKAYGFAGWRIGYMVLPDHLLTAVKKIQDTILICPPVASQYAALGALEAGAGYCRSFVKPMGDVRRLVLDALRPLDDHLTVPDPQGAFYVFLRVHTDLDAMTLVRSLIEQHHVAVIPGTTFGMDEGCYLRIAYGALQQATVAEAMNRLVTGLTRLLGT